MHVLLVVTGYPPEYSGSGGRLHATYRRLADRHPELTWTVITKRRASPSPETFDVGPEAIHAFLEQGSGSRPSLSRILRELLWSRRVAAPDLFHEVDLVHCAGWSWLTLPIVQRAARRGVPILRELTSIGDTGAAARRGAALLRWTNTKASQLVAISPAMAHAVRQQGVTTPVWTRPNGIDTRLFRPPTDAERRRARDRIKAWLPDLDDTAILVMHVGRVRPLKNQLFLAESVARLPGSFHLLMAGPAYSKDDPYYRSIQDRLARADLAGRAAMAEGHLKAVHELLQAADVFAFPSRDEGLGSVTLEALATGVPVVANLMPGITDWLITPGMDGVLATLDPVAFALAVQQAVPLKERSSEIAARAAKRFDATLIDEGYWSLLTRLSASKVSTPAKGVLHEPDARSTD